MSVTHSGHQRLYEIATSTAMILVTATTTLAVAPTSAEAQRLEDLAPNVRQFVSVESTSVLIEHVRLIDGTGTPARDDMSVLIRWV